MPKKKGGKKKGGKGKKGKAPKVAEPPPPPPPPPPPLQLIRINYTMFPGSAPWNFLDFSEVREETKKKKDDLKAAPAAHWLIENCMVDTGSFGGTVLP